jgi:hypothetical protein
VSDEKPSPGFAIDIPAGSERPTEPGPHRTISAALIADARAMLELLRRHEHNGSAHRCPECEAWDGHAADCAWGVLLGRHKASP